MIKIADKLKDILFKENITCECCGKDVFKGERFCEDCFKKLPFNNECYCRICGRKENQDNACIDCKTHGAEFEKARSVFDYKDDVVHLIHSFKNGRRYLASLFADYLKEIYIKEFSFADFITFTPMYIKDEKRRGYNQAKLLADELSKRVNTPVVELLQKVKKTKMQKTLSRKEREKNLVSCFKVVKREGCKGKKILLIDDVMTTGSTINVLSKKLKESGALAVYVLTISSVTLKKNI